MSAKKELLATIEQQRLKISKYEKKLSDLVHAYKSLLKEKEALQASISALSDTQESHNASVPVEQAVANPQSFEHGEASSTEPVEESDSESTFSGLDTESQEVAALRSRVATLKSSLKTISTEKSKFELSLKEDRKIILDERKKIEEQLQDEVSARKKLQKEYKDEIQEMRTKVLVSHHEREQESTNSVMMLRELEGKLSKERHDKEKFEGLLDEARNQNRQLTQVITARTQEKHQKQITDLQNELEQVRSRLKKAEEQCQEPPILKKLQNQMLEMRLQYTDAIKQEQLRAETAEESSRQLSQVHEERVAALEARLTELSLTAVNQDRAKQSHIETIHSLKEKLTEVIEENKELASKVSPRNQTKIESETIPNHDLASDYNSLIENLVKLWNKILNMSANLDEPVDIEAFLSGSEVIHHRCRTEYAQLKQEMENMINNSKKAIALTDENKCSCGLKDQVDDLKERLRNLTATSQMMQAAHVEQMSSFGKELVEIKEKHEKEKIRLLQEQRVTIGALETQLADQCQRSLMTLQDRDEELHRLTQEIHCLTKEAQQQPTTVAAALLSQVSTGGAEGPLLHHLEEMARKDLEISELRKTKRVLERTVRDIQMASIEKQQTMQDSIDNLEEEVARLKRNTSRKGENLEYLKNVVLRYMISIDNESRHLMLNAIAAVLKFTPSEIESVRKFLDLWWWQTPSKTKAPLMRKLSESGPPHSRSPSVTDMPRDYSPPFPETRRKFMHDSN